MAGLQQRLVRRETYPHRNDPRAKKMQRATKRLVSLLGNKVGVIVVDFRVKDEV